MSELLSPITIKEISVLETSKENITNLARELTPIAAQALGFDENFMFNDVLEHIMHFDKIFIAEDNNTPVGFFGCCTIEHPKFGKILCKTGTMIKHSHQGRGFGSHLIKTAIQSEKPNYAVFRSQNPAAYRAIQNAVIGNLVAPTPISYTDFEDMREVMTIVSKEMGVIADPTTGVVRGVLGGGRKFGDYEPRNDNKTRRVVNDLAKIGIDPNNGDAAYITVKLS